MGGIFKRIVFLIFLFFCSYKPEAQNSNTDSLKKVLSNAKDDSIKFWTLQALRVSYTFSYPDTALYYAEQQIKLARKLQSSSLEATALDSKGLVLSVMGNYPEAMSYLLRALRISEQIKNDQWTFWINIHLTNTNIDQGNFNQAIQYGFKSLEVAEKTRNGEYKTSALGHIGSIYEKLHRLDSALYYVRKSYDLELQLKGKHEWNTLPYLLGNIYAKKQDYPIAIHYYHFAIQLALKRNNVKALMNIYNGLATVYHKTGQSDSSIYYAGKTIGAGNKIVNPLAILEASNLLANLYKSRNEKDSVIKYMELATETKDSLFNREKIIHVQNISFRERLRRQEMEAANSTYRSQVKISILIGGLGVLLLIAIILWRNSLNKQRANELLQQQKQEIEYQRAQAEEALKDLKVTQAQLIQREKMASLGELTAGIAHEIQNPLNFVNNFSEVSKELIEEMSMDIQGGNTAALLLISEDIKQNLEMIIKHGRRADAIVKSMLEHSRTGNGKKELADLNALTDECMRIAFHGMRAKEKSFNTLLETHYDPKVGAVAVVPHDIGRVLLNLFNNAFYSVHQKKLKYNGTYEPAILVRTERTRGSISIRIKDNGLGIPEHLIEKIYQPFFTTKAAGEGAGLGLSLSYDIIHKEHGGELKVNTREGEYAEFIIQLSIQD